MDSFNDDPEMQRLIRELNWRFMAHNHQDIKRHDTCPLCVIEMSLYGG